MGLFASFGAGERRRSRKARRSGLKSYLPKHKGKARRSRETVKPIVSSLSERRRSAGKRRRRSHEATVSFAGLSERRRSRRVRRSRRSREVTKVSERRRSRRSRRSREGGFMQAIRFGAALGERRRSRRSRKTARRSRRSREVVKLSERRRSRRSRKTARRSRRRSREVVKLSERRRSRRSRKTARRSRRSREVVKLSERRRSRRSRKTARRSRRSREFGLALSERLRSRRSRRSREGGLFSSYLPRTRSFFASERSGSVSVSRAGNSGTLIDLTKKAGIGAVGLVAGRVVSTLITNTAAKYLPASPTLAKVIGPASAAGATLGIWWLAGTKFMPSVIKRNRELIALGAAFHVIEELAAIVLPMVPGMGPGPGMVKQALYGDSLAGLGACQYGCPEPAQAQTMMQPCGCPPGGATQQLAYVNTPSLAGEGLGACQYGCPEPAQAQTVMQPCGCPPGGQTSQLAYAPPGYVAPSAGPVVAAMAGGYGLAGEMALRKAGPAAQDPFIADILVKRSNEAQRILDAAGMGAAN